MSDFILEEQMEKVVDNKTKEYLKEVLSCYNNGNYKAAVVVLYSIVIFDLLQKIIVLKNVYKEKSAANILQEYNKQQSENSKNPEWEKKLIENICNQTKIITEVEKEELLQLKIERNYAAHPIINIDENNEKIELKLITKETAIDLIRKAFEIVFLRDVILAKNINNDIVEELNEYYKRVNTDGLEQHLNIKYFSRMTQFRKDHLFKCLWKFVFITNDIECKSNRESNYCGLVYLYNENRDHYQEVIQLDEKFYFDQLEIETLQSFSNKEDPEEFFGVTTFQQCSRIICLVKLLQYDPCIYKLLNDFAKNILKASVNKMYYVDINLPSYMYSKRNKDELFKAQVKLVSEAMFLAENLLEHFEMIFLMINKYMEIKKNDFSVYNYLIFDDKSMVNIYQQSKCRGYIEEFLGFLIKYCTGAKQFYQADILFDYLENYKDCFGIKHYEKILEGMNTNSQFYKNNLKSKFLQKLEIMYGGNFESDLQMGKYRNLY